MSAYLVSPATIDCIVAAAIRFGLSDVSCGTRDGQMLLNENVTSLRYRYSDADEFWGDGIKAIPDYVYTPRDDDLWQVLACCDCLDYQSCEHDDWATSEAKAYVDKVRAAALAALNLPSDDRDYHSRPEWRGAHWGF